MSKCFRFTWPSAYLGTDVEELAAFVQLKWLRLLAVRSEAAHSSQIWPLFFWLIRVRKLIKIQKLFHSQDNWKIFEKDRRSFKTLYTAVLFGRNSHDNKIVV